MQQQNNCNSEYCTERFETIERRLNVKSELLDHHNTDIAVLKTDMAHLTKSMNALTKALWGVAGSTIVTLVTFFVWYVQNLGGR